MTSSTKLANQAWEALFRAQATIAGELVAADVWGDLVPSEYGVLYTLSTAPDGLRMTELSQDVLLTQAGMSRLVTRLAARGLVTREDDPHDGRACRIRLTPHGRAVQRQVGSAHGRHVARVMTTHLDRDQLATLAELCRALVAPQEHVNIEGSTA